MLYDTPLQAIHDTMSSEGPRIPPQLGVNEPGVLNVLDEAYLALRVTVPPPRIKRLVMSTGRRT